MGITKKLYIEDNYKQAEVCKGGQAIIVSDVDWILPRSYVHWHKL